MKIFTTIGSTTVWIKGFYSDSSKYLANASARWLAPSIQAYSALSAATSKLRKVAAVVVLDSVQVIRPATS